MPPVDAPDGPVAEDAPHSVAMLPRRYARAVVWSPASWGRRPASTADLAVGALLTVLLAWSAWSLHLAAVEIAAGRVTYGGLIGYRPEHVPELAAQGWGWFALFCPAGVAFVIWMLLRGWKDAVSVGAALLAALGSGVVGLFVGVGVLMRLDFPIASAAASGIGAACGLLTVDALAQRMRMAHANRRRAATALDGDADATPPPPAATGSTGAPRKRIPDPVASTSRALPRTVLVVLGTILLLAVIIDRLIAFSTTGQLLGPPVLLPVPRFDR
ncbi:hypothetical protein GCM10027515_03430 [Schumannella luteola]|uniref:Uncharacterized protein n=1 Tax=Schumannella luteola TaxID=472059 RepID=A0A852YBE6_9MICO|nr:hypothetical protein [Schumannella luteola]NYG98521.1 hypothetical protein [Schumannella luteola]TPX01258.1 hypothetical protein FJ656_28090 [Schumannella luteola]